MDAPHMNAAFPSPPQLQRLWYLNKITVCFPEDAERRNPTNVTSTGCCHSCLSLPTCAQVCRYPGQVVSPGTGRPHSGHPLWLHRSCLKERRRQAAANSHLFPVSKALPSLSETVGPRHAVRCQSRAQQGQGKVQGSSARKALSLAVVSRAAMSAVNNLAG